MKVASTRWSCTAATAACWNSALRNCFATPPSFLHMDATADISHFKIIKSMFPDTAGTYAAAVPVKAG